MQGFTPNILISKEKGGTIMTMRETMQKLRNALRPIYGDRETEAIIRIIFHYLKGWTTVDMLIHEPETLSPFLESEIDGILRRLLRHEPIQYITGEARFHGMEFHVTPDVLIPRPETDELVDIIVGDANDASDLRILDIAAGSGCIAIALARSLPFPRVSALEISEAALKVARDNASRLKADVSFIHADIFKWQPSPASFDIIVSNPPYIDESEKAAMEPNVLEYEPAQALFVPDSDPLVFYRRIAEVARTGLSEGGRLYLEINPRHAAELSELLKKNGFSDIETIKDSYEKDRFIRARLED